jgi:hypothetical protein
MLIERSKKDENSRVVGSMAMGKKKTLLQPMRGTPNPGKLPDSLYPPGPLEHSLQ